MTPRHLATVPATVLATALVAAPVAAQPAAPPLPAPSLPAPDAYQPPEFITAAPALPPGVDPAGAWQLELIEAIRLAVRNNLDVVLEREAVTIADRGVDLAVGEREPTLGVSYRHGDVRTPSSSILEGSPDTINTSVGDAVALSYQQRFATGLTLGADFDLARDRSTSSAAVADLNVRSTATLRVTQPLLRGFSTDLVVPRLAILRARLGAARERGQLEVVLAEVVLRTETAYWDVVAALYRHDLAVRSASRAEAQLALTARQIEAGVLPPSDRISAESTLAQRQLQQLQAEQAVDAAWDRLRAVMNLPRAEWRRAIVPVERPTFAPTAQSLDDALAAALRNRPEPAQLAGEVADAELGVRQARNDRLPQLDLGVSGTLIGQAERAGASLRDLGGADARGWTVMLDLTWTPLGRRADAALAIERSRAAQRVTQRDAALQRIWIEVKDAVRAQDGAAREVAAAARFRQLAEDGLELEQRRFLNGTSSNFLIAQRQEELAAAQVAELTALLDHQKALATRLYATGALLTERGIAVTPGP
ncbi:MAG: TolC family protein [Myxococcales bacterium]|nr:TolC family protein [Myxococcales bacterium]